MRAKYRHFIFSLSLLADGLLMMVEKEGRHQLLGHCFRKGRITGYLEEGLKAEAHSILDGEDTEGQGCCSGCCALFITYPFYPFSSLLIFTFHMNINND